MRLLLTLVLLILGNYTVVAYGNPAVVADDDINTVTATPADTQWMLEAVALSGQSIEAGGGPFGAIVVSKEGKVIGRGYNRVAIDHDPTAHGEVTAIRDAAKNTNAFDLEGAALYTSTYPCPMCFSAAHWANIGHIYYANTAADVSPEFDDAALWHKIQVLNAEGTSQCTTGLTSVPGAHAEAKRVFDQWVAQVRSGAVQHYNPSDLSKF